MKKITSYLVAPTMLIFPVVAMAQDFDPDDRLWGFLADIIVFINNIIIPFLLTLALLFFVYGVFKYFILGGADDEKRGEGKQVILWAVIAFVVIVSVWGIVNLVTSGLGLEENDLNYNFDPVLTNF